MICLHSCNVVYNLEEKTFEDQSYTINLVKIVTSVLSARALSFPPSGPLGRNLHHDFCNPSNQ